MIVNRAASIRARLKQQADVKGEAFELILTRFALERLLYRLSVALPLEQARKLGAS